MMMMMMAAPHLDAGPINDTRVGINNTEINPYTYIHTYIHM